MVHGKLQLQFNGETEACCICVGCVLLFYCSILFVLGRCCRLQVGAFLSFNFGFWRYQAGETTRPCRLLNHEIRQSVLKSEIPVSHFNDLYI